MTARRALLWGLPLVCIGLLIFFAILKAVIQTREPTFKAMHQKGWKVYLQDSRSGGDFILDRNGQVWPTGGGVVGGVHAAGVASLLYSLNPALTPFQVTHILTTTVTAFPCTTSVCGTGILNAANAVNDLPTEFVYLPLIVKPAPLAPPAAPTSLNATVVSYNEIQLTWTDNANNETYFRIERSPDNSIWSEIMWVGMDITSFNNTGLDPDTTYYYRVRAHNAVGVSAYSNVALATTDPYPNLGIHGTVTLNSSPMAGVELELRLLVGGFYYYTIDTTTTGQDGSYSFINVPSLSSGESYEVVYYNWDGTPGLLQLWITRELTSYSAGDEVAIGDFDVADIPLVSPADGATVSLPRTFQWTPRPTTPTDSYVFELWLGAEFNTDPPLGYVGNYTLNSLPPDFIVGEWYAWDILVHSPDGGLGLSLDSHYVSFSNSGFSVVAPFQPTSPITGLDLANRRNR